MINKSKLAFLAIILASLNSVAQDFPEPIELKPQSESQSEEAYSMSYSEESSDNMSYSEAGNEVEEELVDTQLTGTLNETLVNTYINNEKLNAERKNVQFTDEYASQAFAQWMPTLFVEGQGGYSDIDRDTVDSEGEFNSVSADFNLPIYRGGRTTSLTKREKSRIVSAINQLKEVEQEVLFDAAQGYIDVWRDTKLLEYSIQNEEMLKKNLEDTEAKYKLKEVTQTDVFQSKTRYTRAVSDRTRRRANLDSSKARYKSVVGMNPMVVYDYDSPEIFKILDISRFSYDDLMDILLSNHPAIIASTKDAEAARHDVSLKKGALLPTVALNASIEQQHGENLGFGAEDVQSKSVLVNVSIPIFQSGSEYSQVRQAKRKAEQVKFELEDKRKQVIKDLNVSLDNLYASIEENKSNAEHVKVAELSLEGVYYEAQAGARTILDVLDAQQELLEAQIIQTQSQHSEFISSYAVLKSLGMMTAKDLGLATNLHDPEAYYKSVKNKVVGF